MTPGTSVTELVCDASVVLKWFREEGESEVVEARVLLDAHIAGALVLRLLELTYYEVGNSLLRRHHASASEATSVLDAMRAVCGDGSVLAGEELRKAADLAGAHGLTLYDACYAAVAGGRGAALATLDSELLAVGLGERPSDLVARLGI